MNHKHEHAKQVLLGCMRRRGMAKPAKQLPDWPELLLAMTDAVERLKRESQ